jgi:hypothetical protein
MKLVDTSWQEANSSAVCEARMPVLVYGHGATDTVYAVPKCSPGRSRPLLPCAPLLHCQRVYQASAGKLAMLPDILTICRQYVWKR